MKYKKKKKSNKIKSEFIMSEISASNFTQKSLDL